MFIKTPLKGTFDYLPTDVELREYVKKIITDTYTSYGFNKIETPIMDHIENLSNNQGGENEKLIFKVLKRGEKLSLDVTDEDELCDSALRYDLTLPLSRYYSNNANLLQSPFKAFQIGPVFRAERPQKGRLRQFIQCDIDILGEESNLAEIDLIQATSTCLQKLSFKKFTIRINDRNILKAMASYAGFNEKDYDSVFISLDKLDKIGKDGVYQELNGKGFNEDIINKYLDLFDNDKSDIKDFCSKFNIDINSFIEIIDTINSLNIDGLTMEFDPTLVRGMSYYTGTIFEISLDGYPGSCGGGGRYDEMISKFSNLNTPACGFSIGFERIILILKESNFIIPNTKTKYAYIVEKGSDINNVLIEARKKRELGNIVLVTNRKKNTKFQKELLTNEGYEIIEIFNK